MKKNLKTLSCINTSVIGDQGIPGTKGPDGDDGITGERGDAGFKGERGLMGTVGFSAIGKFGNGFLYPDEDSLMNGDYVVFLRDSGNFPISDFIGASAPQNWSINEFQETIFGGNELNEDVFTHTFLGTTVLKIRGVGPYSYGSQPMFYYQMSLTMPFDCKLSFTWTYNFSSELQYVYVNSFRYGVNIGNNYTNLIRLNNPSLQTSNGSFSIDLKQNDVFTLSLSKAKTGFGGQPVEVLISNFRLTPLPGIHYTTINDLQNLLNP